MLTDNHVMQGRLFPQCHGGLLADDMATEMDYYIGLKALDEGFILEGELPGRAVR